MREALVKAEQVCKDFSTVSVLKDVSVELFAGEILGLIGENGAGKSTLMKILSGIYQPSSGRIIVGGAEKRFRGPSGAKAAGIAIVPQEFNLCPQLTVEENVFLGSELLDEGKPGRLLDKKQMRERTARLISQLGASIAPSDTIETLSAAQKQLVEICKALALDARVLILDEPTTVLTKVEAESLFGVMRALKARGIAIVYISHKLAEVKEICDRVIVLRDGQVVHEAGTGDFSLEEMARRMVGRELSDVFPSRAEPQEEVLLAVEGLASTGSFEDISFELRAGEILGFAGLVGAGRTEVAEAIMALRPSTGVVRVNGRELKRRRPKDAVAAGIGYLSEDRQGSGVLVPFSLAENATLVALRRYSGAALGWIDRKRERQSAERWRSLFAIKAESVDQSLDQLSGGNQQKVSLAKSLDAEPRILIVDEPTRGVDIGAKHEIYRLIADLAAKGMAILLISSELEEIIGMCDRVLVMREGRQGGIVAGEAINEEEIMYLATGIREGA